MCKTAGPSREDEPAVREGDKLTGRRDSAPDVTGQQICDRSDGHSQRVA